MNSLSLGISLLAVFVSLATLVYTRKIFQAQRWMDLSETITTIKLFVNEVVTRGSTRVEESVYKNLYNLYLSRVSFFKKDDKATLLIEKIMSRYQKLLMANSLIQNLALTGPEKIYYQQHIDELRKYFVRLAQEDLLKSDKDLDVIKNDKETINECFKDHIDYGKFS